MHFKKEDPVAVVYKKVPVGEGRVDFLVESRLIVELRAIEALAPIHKSQLISYLCGMNLPLGRLINFNVPILKDGVQHVILT
jgi:GxxExxY protein